MRKMYIRNLTVGEYLKAVKLGEVQLYIEVQYLILVFALP